MFSFTLLCRFIALSLVSFGSLVGLSTHSLAQNGSWQISTPVYTCTYSSSGPAHITQTNPNTIYGGGNMPGTLTVAGTAAVTCTWQSPTNDPPPAQVIVQESMVGSGGKYQSGQATYTGPPPVVQYWVKSVTSGSFTLTSPSMTATVTLGSPGAGGYANVTYSPAVYPLTLNLSGGIGPSYAKSLMIGQQLSASLISGPLTQKSWNWTVSGGNPFLDYIAVNSGAIYTSFSSQTTASMYCYFAKPTTLGALANVVCMAHLAVPAGALPTAGLDVTVTQTVTVDKPSAILNVVIGSVNAEPGSPANPTFVELEQYPQSQPSGNACGIQWSGTIVTPAAYVLASDYGKWSWTQLMTTSRQMKDNGVYWQLAINTTNPYTKINNKQVLDGGYPYGDWYPATNVQAVDSDSPAQGLSSDPVIREFDVSDSFDDYLMYQPPGANSLPVPLKETDWYWTFQALKNASSIWSISGNNAAWGFVADFPAFPLWNLYAPDGCLVYAP